MYSGSPSAYTHGSTKKRFISFNGHRCKGPKTSTRFPLVPYSPNQSPNLNAIFVGAHVFWEYLHEFLVFCFWKICRFVSLVLLGSSNLTRLVLQSMQFSYLSKLDEKVSLSCSQHCCSFENLRLSQATWIVPHDIWEYFLFKAKLSAP